jgi:hypothetical protein
LPDKDTLVRPSAALALAQSKAKQAVQHALDDSSGAAAFAAAQALTEIGDSSGRDMLIAVLAGELKEGPGIITNAIRDAKKRLRDPEASC